ncbi:DUF6221 family protein [Streptomyces liangshanensis]|uniref:Uncharacterized protein n=1 Tax=Streptomyces liangshanensis TaxID=2717324 RepID=A0A6G9GUE8_9ACTN|nr:DUF6221 family protein [Streptomyces liangshanensis]QIQ01892.1 hypothetical protein HA039_05940 [Streptomyces liangshanensis]
MSNADLVAFVRARLDEREAVARAARPTTADPTAGHWVAAHPRASPQDEPDPDLTVVGAQEPDGREWIVAEAGRGERSPAIAMFIADHDPDAVLRRVVADRVMLDAYADLAHLDVDGNSYDYPSGQAVGLGFAVRHLAALDAGHPDYQATWLPRFT